ncbi:MAG: polyprenyl synthetase family protein [Anaplasma sp.]
MAHTFKQSLDELRDFVSEDLERVEQLIVDKSNSDVSHITNVIQHLILSGGKRIRPVMLLAVCKMLALDDERKIRVAAAIELIHSATLLHDDVVDQSGLRRGVRTSNSIWGNKTSILVGDFLFAVAFQWIVSCRDLGLLSVLSQTSSTIIVGEIQQMLHSNSLDITREKYLEIISAKTAALFSASCESAAVLSKTSPSEREALRNFGYNFGIAFQIMDDLLDYTAQRENLGKPSGSDFGDGKVTIPLIIAYASAGQEDKRLLKNALSDATADFATAFSYIKSQGITEQVVEFATGYIDSALASLDVFPDSQGKSKLLALLRSALMRQR